MKKIVGTLSKMGGAISILWTSTKSVYQICMRATKGQTIALMLFSLGSAFFLAWVSWVNAQVVTSASAHISNENFGFSDSQSSGLLDILQKLMRVNLLSLAVAYGILASANAFVGLFQYLITSSWGTKMRHEVDAMLRQQRTRLDIGCLHSAKYEDMKIRIQEQAHGWGAITDYANLLAQLAGKFANLIIFGLGLFYFNPSYAGILFIGILPRAISEFYWNSRFWKFNDDEMVYTKRRGVFAQLFFMVISLHELKLFGKAEVADRAIRRNQRDQIVRKEKLVRGDFISSTVTEFISAITLVLVVIQAIYTAVLKRDVALLIITLDFSVRFAANLKQILLEFSSVWNAARSVNVITGEFFGLEPLIPQTGNPVLDGFKRISFRDLKFRYPDTENLVLNGVNLDIPVGAKLALVGESGGGKSTIALLLARQYDPIREGDDDKSGVFLDDIPLTSIHPQDWFNHCLCMGQDYAIPHVTILEAICYGIWNHDDDAPIPADKHGICLGLQGVDMDAVRRACKRANILHVIESKTKGFDTVIGTEYGGVDFSKGEKQRIALAARLFAERPFMVFDEPDAALDPKSKELVVRGILDTNSTVVLVIHNLRACELCDLVAFVKDGKVVEFGSHRDLLAKGGLYAEMYNYQVVTTGQGPSIIAE